ncbi:hypothetical protein CC85DRAFT_288374 [Cutaneotrichosporon oleaginosum]|uniref:Zn(2)-C6 fungal-type domain-containing protein n=1 Tax=Cutaneotrichosporon oleaginosum TaxID=879819 RepID=A0A0J0XF14_9TREE|nr:uncharacterized protein CC85DRAFT_288374 [Cutaneotrichosporon oleaginosum]KLT39643.1 hypothetical protein CC85DRAFT_288374 [Cutaneotrichosporon oleaginosum]TXT05661.1 hypothetical protein COLE_06981 [Cutaneotrichosporon oleaginosum]
MRSDGKPRQTRQHFSCAECRRLKLKCSRTWPCTSCVKRHCEQICPFGQAKTIKGKRIVLADAEHLHERIRKLEVALSQERSKNTQEPHPLLIETDWFTTEDGAGPSRLDTKPETGAIDAAAGAFGTLKIGTEGEAHFIGSFAGSEYLREEGQTSEPNTPSDHMRTSEFYDTQMAAPVSRAAYSETALKLHDAFLAGGVGIAGVAGADYNVDALRAELPDLDPEGYAILNVYWDNVNWMYQPISRALFERDYLLNAYDASVRPHPHKLAATFFLMAVGVLFDLSRNPWDDRAAHLFFCGRACLGLVGLENASPATVLALHLMGTYILNDKIGNSADVFWPILGTATRVAQSLGLHRDGLMFGLSPYEVQERRMLYWEVLTYDRLQALCFGRPCAMSNRSSDTLLPDDEALAGDEDGFHRSKYRLIEIMERVLDVQTNAKPTPYSTVQAVDKEITTFRENLPDTMLPKTQISDLPMDRMLSPQIVIHRLSIRFLVAQTRLLLNRHWFTIALKDSPEDPGQSPFGDAFIAVFESASEIVQTIRQLVRYHPSLIARWWFFWFHALSASVCLAAVAIRAPLSVWAVPSYQKLQQMVDISAATRDGCRAKNGLGAILQLRLSASEAMEAAAKTRRRASQPLAFEDPATVSYLEHLKAGAKLVRVGTGQSPVRDNSQSPSAISGTLPELRTLEALKQEMSSSRPGSANVPYLPLNQLAAQNAEFPSSQWLSELVWQPPDGMSMGDLGMGPPVDMDTSIALGIGSSQHELLDAFVNGVGRYHQR